MIAVEHLEITYPNGTCALADCSVRFDRGAFTVLLGASGAGKSSLLRSINGLVEPSRGKIAVEGIGELNSADRMRAQRRRTGMIFQQHQLIGRISVLQNVLTGRLGFHSSLRTLISLPPAEKRLALEAIERVGLIDYALRRADQLSGGQQQRVGIARALVQQPSLILADEPVASLDPASADRVLSLLKRICAEDGITAVVSLHQLEFAKHYADRIVALAQGRIVFDGGPGRLGKPEIARIYGATPAGVAETADEDFTLKTGTYA